MCGWKSIVEMGVMLFKQQKHTIKDFHKNIWYVILVWPFFGFGIVAAYQFSWSVTQVCALGIALNFKVLVFVIRLPCDFYWPINYIVEFTYP